MGETFRPILPRMRCRVRADVILPPSLRRAILVMALQRLSIVFTLVAEDCAKRRKIGRPSQQNVPIVVTDLVTEMSDQRAIGLVRLRAARFAFGVIGLRDVGRDLAFVLS